MKHIIEQYKEVIYDMEIEELDDGSILIYGGLNDRVALDYLNTRTLEEYLSYMAAYNISFEINLEGDSVEVTYSNVWNTGDIAKEEFIEQLDFFVTTVETELLEYLTQLRIEIQQ